MREAELEKKLVERVKELGGEGMNIFQRLYGRQRVWVRTDAGQTGQTS